MTKGLFRAQEPEPLALKLTDDEYNALWGYAVESGLTLEEAARCLIREKVRKKKKEGLFRPLLAVVK